MFALKTVVRQQTQCVAHHTECVFFFFSCLLFSPLCYDSLKDKGTDRCPGEKSAAVAVFLSPVNQRGRGSGTRPRRLPAPFKLLS